MTIIISARIPGNASFGPFFKIKHQLNAESKWISDAEECNDFNDVLMTLMTPLAAPSDGFGTLAEGMKNVKLKRKCEENFIWKSFSF